ncbi:GspE/PulE/PilB domain-containing protein [Phycisphaera mikurensis]|uniref:Type II secretion system protein GspE N-terminal domain-containing protein n=1 Tax=Phycisphaera mikurensis (strain NBRC 102666 / KCTC 22515 / FYK2301M01) TaxID=1142394 RepID=I0IIC5_PHYMF|nr:hypothetical protein [Phycisphaera mikurensis]MBB6442423.1 hypothetical protein [Phycisphaera mikurensis]BAM05013.1 hypothetical protein PSMK_28540 [Phycisphaera mikurensis NBRC 102666]
MNGHVLRIGELLVQQGRLTRDQAEEVARRQEEGPVPFGLLAERMFGVSVDGIEEAWVEQYHRATGTLTLRGVEPEPAALAMLHRRQASQFRMVPLRFEASGELLIAACRTRLARAVTFAAHRIAGPTHFRVAASGAIDAFLERHYAPERALRAAG